ncbi:hypothetical protein MGN70_003969 [Eutypa lata]|nr:hypothetical protein MGN70_003969 [Eutypa lata]
MITTCLIFCLYCEALGLQPSANLGRLDESVTGIVNRSEKESGQGSPGSDVGWTKADNLALAGVLATIVGVFLSATLTTWLQRWQLVRSQAHSNQRVDVEAGYRADTCLRVTLERQAVAHLANNSSNESFFSAAQELEETQPIDETVFYVGDTIAMPMPPPIAHLRS